jgi:hypothetical protein
LGQFGLGQAPTGAAAAVFADSCQAAAHAFSFNTQLTLLLLLLLLLLLCFHRLRAS